MTATTLATPARLRTPRGIERRIATVAALVGVNAFAIVGQASWAYQNLGHSWALAGAFAAVLESISIYLASMATAALLANDRAGGLRVAAYAAGLLIGAMNYAAHAPDWQPNAMAIAFGTLSTLSPWLWSIQARRQHRDQLAAAGLIDPRTVKIPLMLWTLYPVRALRMLRLAVLVGENRPGVVRQMYAERTALRSLDGPEAVRYAFGQLATYDTHLARVWLQQRGKLVTTTDLTAATGSRPPAPRTPRSAPVSPEAAATPAAPAAVTADAAEAALRADLDAAQTNRDRIRIALHAIGEPSAPRARQWLLERGHRVGKSESYAVLREATGEHPTVPVNGARPLALVEGARR